MAAKDSLGREHFAVAVLNIPPEAIQCSCGEQFRGELCIDEMTLHMEEENREDTPPAPSG